MTDVMRNKTTNWRPLVRHKSSQKPAVAKYPGDEGTTSRPAVMAGFDALMMTSWARLACTADLQEALPRLSDAVCCECVGLTTSSGLDHSGSSERIVLPDNSRTADGQGFSAHRDQLTGGGSQG